MNAFTRFLLLLPALLAAPGLLASPSQQLPHEWVAPLETGSALVIVETATGQARILEFSGDFVAADSGPRLTHLPEVTGLNTGFFGGGPEHVVISSTNTNAVRLLNTDDFSLTSFHPEVPGPITAVPVRESLPDPSGLYQLSAYGDESNVLQKYLNVLAPTPSPEGSPVDRYPVYDLQPTRVPGFPGIQAGIISLDLSGDVNLYEARPVPLGIDYDFIATGGTVGEKIATQCLGSDGRLCVLRFQPGSPTATIVTQPYLGFPVSSATSNLLPFRIGTIAPVPSGIANAPHGVLITAQNGSQAVYAHIDSGNTFSIQATFTPDAGNILTGLVPIPGRGFLALEGSEVKKRSTSWSGYRNDGGGWDQVSAGVLSPWLGAQVNFATLFWFNGTPLVEPTAEIIKLETRGDWTRKTSNDPIPAQVELSELASPEDGLIPSALLAPSAPAGANFLLTSQREAQVSITALGDDLSVQSPSVSLSPPSGDYPNPVTVTALYEEGANDLFYREDKPNSPWQLFDTLTVGYPSSWLFYARNLSTGFAGPIMRRDFTFSGLNPNDFDSDGDGVPDYVERYLGLDPAGGADSDGDFQSDLEEILADPATDPADSDSNTPPGDPRDPPFLGEGFELIAQAFDAAGLGASPANDFVATTEEDDFPGETLRAWDLHGNLLAEENVVELTAPPALAGQDGAFMQVGTQIDEAAWITLTAPTTFGVLDVLNPARTGREIIKVMPRPVNPVAEVVTSPSGTDRDADAAVWITAAKIAYGSHETIAALTELRPVDNALSALAEQALFSSLQTLPLADQVLLGVPPAVADFTLFPQRNGESARTPFSREMWEALRDAGCDFPALIELLELAAADPDVVTVANAIASIHAANSDANPLMALPLDAFRSIIRTGVIIDPAPGDPPRPDPYAAVDPVKIASAKTTFDTHLAQVAGTKRPVETWSIVIAPSTTPLHQYDYVREGTTDKVWLRDRAGERILLEQGLGLALGTLYEITGYPDVTAPAGFVGFEPIRVESVVTPLASDTDANANLLDDGWENVFFGDLGVVDPFDPHPDTGHSYLQYQLTGADPRSGSLADPVVTIYPTSIFFEWVPAANAYDYHFNFPAEFIDQFDFVLQSSADLQGFSGPADQSGLQVASPGNYFFRINTTESNLDANFFRLGLSLK